MSDETSSPPAKRQRTENEPEAIARSAVWYDDGNVVLQAGNTQFRVHWGVLAQHSPFFQAMRGLPQPPDQPSVDGCPIVELSGDDTTDVEILLKVLYSPTFLAQTALPIVAIGALIRLGRKYDFRELLDSATARLTFEYPTTLEGFDARGGENYKLTCIMPHRGLRFDIISLARENGILSVLPCAYYRALYSTLDELFDGIAKPDGTLASLAPVDIRRCLRAREELTTIQVKKEYACGWFRFWNPGFDCSSGQCSGTTMRDAWLRKHLDDPKMRALNLFVPTDIWAAKICAACKESIGALNAAGRKRTWDELPGFFDLPAWSELKNDQ